MEHRYDSVRAAVRSGDIIATTHTSWRSLYDIQIQLVRFFTQSEYSHVGVALVEGDDIYVFESVIPTVRKLRLSALAEQGFYWVPLGTVKPASIAEIESMYAMHGKARYSRWEAVRAFFKNISIGKNRYWECAEAVIFWRWLSQVSLGLRATPAAVVKAAQVKYGLPIYFVKKEPS